MKLALQMAHIPGKTVRDRTKWALDHGVEGLELAMKPIDQLRAEAAATGGQLPVSSVCGNCDAHGNSSFDFLHPDPQKRRTSIDGSKAILEFCGEVGAVGQIVPPIFGPPLVPDLSPFKTPLEIEEELCVAALKELGPFAAARKTLLLLEPLNRYEQHYLKTQADGVRVIRKARTKGVGMLSDLFHMHIEETDTPRALIEASKYVTHVHLADNTRCEPGTGDIDFLAAFKALHKIGFRGYMAYECKISGDTDSRQRANLAKSLDFLRACIRKAER